MIRVSTAAASAALAAGMWSLVLGYADLKFRQGDEESVREAVRLAPFDAGFLAQASVLVEPADSAESARLLDRAIASNPWYSWAWMQRGLLEERPAGSSGQARAEADLLRAAEVDRGFAPRWTLLNYFLRAGNSERFWFWAGQATAVEGASPEGVFRLGWRVSPARLPGVVATSARHRFLRFLLEEHPREAEVAVVSSLLRDAGAADLQALDGYGAALLSQGRVRDAVSLWNALCERRLLAFEKAGRETGNLLINASFAIPPSGRFFDWRIHAVPGVERRKDSLWMSGDQPEHCRLLEQMVPVRPGAGYVFRSGMLPAGVHWRILGRAGILGETGPATPSAAFLADTETVTVALDYDRPRGEVRFAGSLPLSGLTLSETRHGAGQP